MRYAINYLYQAILSILSFVIIAVVCCLGGCVNNKKVDQPSPNWCDHETRPALKKLTAIKTKNDWFRVYPVGDKVYAIVEPYNYEEVISYLILGVHKALLFDTGMGLDSISPLVKEITSLPIVVLNSHTHYDHIGGNYEFDNILAMNTDFTRKNAANGWAHDAVKQEVTPGAFCLQHLQGTDTAHYRIKPFNIATFINDGYSVDLGGRIVKVIAVPGHTPDAIALLDEHSGYLWTGDTFYEGPIFLFSEGTDLAAYGKSIEKLALLAPGLKTIFPSHNNPIAEPHELIDAHKAFMEIKAGIKKGKPGEDKTVLFEYDRFSFLIGNELLDFKQ